MNYFHLQVIRIMHYNKKCLKINMVLKNIRISSNLKTMLSTCDRCGKLDLIFSVAIICTMVKPYHNYVRNRNSHN